MSDRPAHGLADDRVIRPAAVIEERAARAILDELAHRDVARGGVWTASSALWQRFDEPWNGSGGMRGTARQVGAVYVTYNRPTAHWVTLHRVTVTEHGSALGWSVDSLADEVLGFARLRLASVPRDATMLAAPARDPFRS